MYQGMVQMQYCTQDIDAARLAMEEQWRDDFESPLSTYIGQFAEIENRKEERERRRLDMDRYRNEVKNRTEKGATDRTFCRSTLCFPSRKFHTFLQP